MIRTEVIVLDEEVFDKALTLKKLGPQDLVIGIGFTMYAFTAGVHRYARNIVSA